MSDECGELIGRLLVEVIFRTLVAGVLLFIDRQVVERRDIIIRWGRRTQHALRVPRCLRAFTDTDPGMLDREIRFAAQIAFGSGLAMNCGLLIFILEPEGKTRNIICLVLVVVYPAVAALVTWLALVLARRRLERRFASCEKINHTDGDMGLATSIGMFMTS